MAVFSICKRTREKVVSGPNGTYGVPFFPAPPCPAAPPCFARTRPTRGVQVLDSTGAFRESLVLVEYALRLIQTYGNELCSALGGWLKSASFVCVAVSAV